MPTARLAHNPRYAITKKTPQPSKPHAINYKAAPAAQAAGAGDGATAKTPLQTTSVATKNAPAASKTAAPIKGNTLSNVAEEGDKKTASTTASVAKAAKPANISAPVDPDLRDDGTNADLKAIERAEQPLDAVELKAVENFKLLLNAKFLDLDKIFAALADADSRVFAAAMQENNRAGFYPFMMFARFGTSAQFSAICKRMNTKLLNICLKQCDENTAHNIKKGEISGRTGLMYACMHETCENLKDLIKNASVDALYAALSTRANTSNNPKSTEDDHTTFSMAAKYMHPEAFAALLEKLNGKAFPFSEHDRYCAIFHAAESQPPVNVFALCPMLGLHDSEISAPHNSFLRHLERQYPHNHPLVKAFWHKYTARKKQLNLQETPWVRKYLAQGAKPKQQPDNSLISHCAVSLTSTEELKKLLSSTDDAKLPAIHDKTIYEWVADGDEKKYESNIKIADRKRLIKHATAGKSLAATLQTRELKTVYLAKHGHTPLHSKLVTDKKPRVAIELKADLLEPTLMLRHDNLEYKYNPVKSGWPLRLFESIKYATCFDKEMQTQASITRQDFQTAVEQNAFTANSFYVKQPQSNSWPELIQHILVEDTSETTINLALDCKAMLEAKYGIEVPIVIYNFIAGRRSMFYEQYAAYQSALSKFIDPNSRTVNNTARDIADAKAGGASAGTAAQATASWTTVFGKQTAPANAQAANLDSPLGRSILVMPKTPGR